MKRKLLCLAVFVMALLMAGCSQRTVGEMYSLPKRSEAYNDLQADMDMAMAGGLTYSAPLSGENRQSVQMADLDGDGRDEYLVFAKGSSEKPLRVLIFNRDGEDKFQLADVIQSSGTAFEQIEYVTMDEEAGCEIIISRQVSDQVIRNVSVYSFREGDAQQVMSVGCSRFLTCDLNGNGRSELLVVQPGEEEKGALAVLYSLRDGMLERSMEVELSEQADNIRRITLSALEGGLPAAYVTSAVGEDAFITDILAIADGKFANVSLSSESGDSRQTLRNHHIYGQDVDGDGVMELPSILGMQPLSSDWTDEEHYLIRWYSVDGQGREVDKIHSFHNYASGWYVLLDSIWASRVTVEQVGNTYIFYAWDEANRSVIRLFTVYALSGSDRQTQAGEDGRFALCHTESIVYAAKVEDAAQPYGIIEDTLINSFRLIQGNPGAGDT